VKAVEFTRWFLAVFFPAVAIFYTIRILAEKARTGTSPVFSGTPGTTHFATHLTFRVFRVAILVVCCARLAWPGVDIYLVPIPMLAHPAVLLTGDALLLASFTAVLYIHFYMGEDWRSGTRQGSEPRLITSGPFAFSRNPMMMAVIAAQLGLFLALPSLFTLVCLAAGLWAVPAQVRTEEHLLEARYGPAYDAYATRTPRWLGSPRPLK
jgi:protein-S-isoprenylcysteine O-methyltransferase Ste14